MTNDFKHLQHIIKGIFEIYQYYEYKHRVFCILCLYSRDPFEWADFKLTKNQIIKMISDKNGTFVKEEIIKNRRIITIRCNICNNVWSSPLNNIKIGKWCKICFDNINIVDRSKILELVLSMGYLLQTDGPLNRNSRFKVNCPIHDITWETCYGNLKYKNGKCKLCSIGFPSNSNIEKLYLMLGGNLLEERHFPIAQKEI